MRTKANPDAIIRRLRPAKIVTAAISVAALVLDLGTKGWVRASLPSPDGFDPLPFLALRPRYNEGTMFGLLSGGTTLSLMVLVTVTVLVILALSWWIARAQEPWVVFGAGLMAAGALGNLVDRLAVGLVTDFIGLRHRRNEAGSGITVIWLAFPRWPNFPSHGGRNSPAISVQDHLKKPKFATVSPRFGFR